MCWETPQVILKHLLLGCLLTDFPSGCGSFISSRFSFIPTASTNPKAALKSKIVAEFRVSL